MKKKVLLAMSLSALLTAPCIAAQKKSSPPKLTVVGGESLNYRCDKGAKITVKYYRLSDDSLYFVKVTLPDGKVYTLPQAMSASGERYTAERELVWWVKNDVGFVEMRGEDGEYKTIFDNCIILRKK